MANWEHDGVGLGGLYLETKLDGLRAGVHSFGGLTESHLWTPGCGFRPEVRSHATVDEAKTYCEQRLGAMTGGAA